jgi:tetratricopeptide (TPR) repeat protein
VKALACVVVAVLAFASCSRASKAPEESAAPAIARPTAAGAPAQETQALIERGQLDEALARLDAGSGDPDALALLGTIWAKKAESAPLPTPPPLPSPAPKKATPPPAPEFKVEEITALGFLDKALAARPGHPGASLALAQLLAPHAIRRFDLEEAASRKPRKAQPAAAAATSGEPDYSPNRVGEVFKAAVAGSPTAGEPVEQLYQFATRVGRMDDAQWALEELLKRQKEKPEPLVRYGDFLRDQKKDPRAAIERYREALIWRPDDAETLAKIADIYIGEGIEFYGKNQWAVAQARLQEAQKYVKNPNSPQGLKIKDYLGKLAAIRQSPR